MDNIQKKSGLQKIRPKSIPEKAGWTIHRDVSLGKEGTTVPRAKQSEENKPSKVVRADEDQATQEQSDFGVISDQFLPDEVLDLIAKMSGSTDAMSIKESSFALNELINKTDLEKLKKYSETHQLSLKEELALSYMLLFSQSLSNSRVGDITKRAAVDTNLTIEEASAQLAELENNYKEIQQACNDFLGAFATFGPSLSDGAKAFLKIEAAYVMLALTSEFLIIPQFGEVVPDAKTFLLITTSMLLPAVSGTIGYEIYSLTPAFRATVTGIVDNLNLKLGLP